MISFEEVKKYLPHYLSAESQSELFEDLKKFPNNIDQRFYSYSLTKDENFYQGDGVRKLLITNLPNAEIKPLPSIILSNTCDISPQNERLFPTRILYAPIFQLAKYREALIEDHVQTNKIDITKIDSHIESIKKQIVTQVLFLPKGANLQNDSIVFLDRINNCPVNELIKEKCNSDKLFTLSNYGNYVFLIKLSIHLTRIREGVDRILQ